LHFSFSWKKEKYQKKIQGKREAPPLCRFAVPAPPQVRQRTFLLFGLSRDTLVTVTFISLAGVHAQFIRTYRCEI